MSVLIAYIKCGMLGYSFLGLVAKLFWSNPRVCCFINLRMDLDLHNIQYFNGLRIVEVSPGITALLIYSIESAFGWCVSCKFISIFGRLRSLLTFSRARETSHILMSSTEQFLLEYDKFD